MSSLKAWLRSAALSKKRKRAHRNRKWRNLQLWFEGRTLHWSLYLVLGTLLTGAVLGLQHYRSSFFYVVQVEGEEVGMVRDDAAVYQFLEELRGTCSSFYGMDVELEQDISLHHQYCPGGEEDALTVKEALRQQISLLTDAVMLTVDEKPVAPLKSDAGVEEAVELLSNFYIDQADHKLLKATLVEEIAATPCSVPPESIYTPEEVMVLLRGGKDPGEGRMLLASRSGDDLREEERCPKVHVQTVEEVKMVEKIPYKTSYRHTSKLWYAQSREVVKGKAGQKEIAYHVTRENGKEIGRQKVGEKVLKKPVARVVEKGTAQAPSLGSGRFLWPVLGGGRITSGYRSASRPRHEGIDIYHSDECNTCILAADSGVVVDSSWDPARGNYIVIFHGNYYTVYAHNRVNKVSAGSKVERGQVIAMMGNSGRTYGRTGVHLHFEVRQGKAKKWSSNPTVNPLNFFSR